MLLNAILVAAAVLQSGSTYNPTGPKIEFTMANGKSFVITTDPKTSPKTVAYILQRVKEKFYDRQRVHRVENWVTQWGAQQSKTEPLDVEKDGKKEPNDKVASGGYPKDIEKFEPADNIDYVRGMVGVASTGLQVAGGSQIFVLKKDALRLYRSYAVVGKVTKGLDVVGTILRGDRIRSARVLNDRGRIGGFGAIPTTAVVGSTVLTSSQCEMRVDWQPNLFATGNTTKFRWCIWDSRSLVEKLVDRVSKSVSGMNS